jgi:hypothetical protein
VQAQQYRQIECAYGVVCNAEYPIAGALLVSHPFGVHGVFETLREMIRANGQRRADELAEAEEGKRG